MRRFGSVLMALGAIVGVGTGLAVLTGVDIPGVGSWLVAVAVAKLGFIAAFALIGGGAILRRVAVPPEHTGSPDSGLPNSSTARPLTSGTAPIQPVAKRDAVEQERRTPL
jgi:hypothetical protein